MKIQDIYKFLLLAAATMNLARGSNNELTWEGMPVRNVTDQLNFCSTLPSWFSGVNTKKTCLIDDSQYYMKAISSNSLQETFAREFVKKNLGIAVPDTELLYEANGEAYNFFYIPVKREYYIASKEMDNFTKATNFIPSLYSFFDSSDKVGFFERMRKNIVQKIGEYGVAQFGVAITFINDLHNLNNWGYDKKGLVLIDVDSMIDCKDITNFFDFAVSNLRDHKHWGGMDFSYNNIKQMKSIYKKMQNKSIPKIHEKVDMNNETYQDLLSCNFAACELALRKIESQMPGVKHSKPSSEINQILIDSFRETYLKYDDSLIRRIKYYLS
ncbi:hypothetical protein [Legionella sp. W05-934-2]|uniref:hypothetical protein n=1 Tax=Legionella sp. W05-934-2 TaxID=1198649 RepID=UPI0034619973